MTDHTLLDEDFKLTLELGNAGLSTPAEVAEILRNAALRLDAGHTSAPLLDVNGNVVGYFNGTFPEYPDAD